MLAHLTQAHKWGDANMPTPSAGAFRIAAELPRVDRGMVGADAELRAVALADPDSKFLFTPDKMLTENEDICNHEMLLRANGKRNATLRMVENL